MRERVHWNVWARREPGQGRAIRVNPEEYIIYIYIWRASDM